MKRECLIRGEMIEQQIEAGHGWEALKETSHCTASSFLMLEGFW